MALKDRISEIVAAGHSKASIARAAGVSPGAVSQWLSGGTKEIKSAAAAGIQAKTGFNAVWIATGKGPKKIDPGNVSQIKARKSVPLVSWVKAGSFGEVEDFFANGDIERWEEAFTSNPGEDAFALVVEGDSMTSPTPGSVSFPHGTIIIVDPGRSSGPGDFVVAKDIATQKATFKQLTYDGGHWFLRPLNPIYPTVEIDDPSIRVIARAIEYRTGGKL